MFAETRSFSSFAVNDREAARRFYGETLGLTTSDVAEGMPLLDIELAGGHHVLIYEKPDHEPAGFTVLNFSVDDVDAAVDELGAKGVEFERYGEEFGQDEKGIAREGGPQIAWFRDPAGNVLSVLEEI
jgi:catechol 2,3-dioxygenase-like lactoylglutathione lyase family enzyme